MLTTQASARAAAGGADLRRQTQCLTAHARCPSSRGQHLDTRHPATPTTAGPRNPQTRHIFHRAAEQSLPPMPTRCPQPLRVQAHVATTGSRASSRHGRRATRRHPSFEAPSRTPIRHTSGPQRRHLQHSPKSAASTPPRTAGQTDRRATKCRSRANHAPSSLAPRATGPKTVPLPAEISDHPSELRLSRTDKQCRAPRCRPSCRNSRSLARRGWRRAARPPSAPAQRLRPCPSDGARRAATST
mmetsp:Transcript_6712/g.25171  ORF Transcript_6712/g.25171 Transcript_6712/m.25171 type:complete len:244 (+) Transcript_6712:562-1293(+)